MSNLSQSQGSPNRPSPQFDLSMFIETLKLLLPEVLQMGREGRVPAVLEAKVQDIRNDIPDIIREQCERLGWEVGLRRSYAQLRTIFFAMSVQSFEQTDPKYHMTNYLGSTLQAANIPVALTQGELRNPSTKQVAAILGFIEDNKYLFDDDRLGALISKEQTSLKNIHNDPNYDPLDPVHLFVGFRERLKHLEQAKAKEVMNTILPLWFSVGGFHISRGNSILLGFAAELVTRAPQDDALADLAEMLKGSAQQFFSIDLNDVQNSERDRSSDGLASVAYANTVDFVRTFNRSYDRAQDFINYLIPEVYFRHILSEVRRLESQGAHVDDIKAFFTTQASKLSLINETLHPHRDGMGLNLLIDFKIAKSHSSYHGALQEILREALRGATEIIQRRQTPILPYYIAMTLKSISEQL